jgi:hypothetical protein
VQIVFQFIQATKRNRALWVQWSIPEPVALRFHQRHAYASAITGLKCNQVRPPRDASLATIGSKKEAMPFDGTVHERRVRSLDKRDKVIDLLSDERRWCKKQLRSPDGRYCIAGAMMAVDARSDQLWSEH